MRPKQLATLIVAALSLLHSTAGGSIRRKRRYVVFQGATSDDMDGVHNLPSQNGPSQSNRQVRATSHDVKGHGRQLKKGRSRRGDYLSNARGESESDAPEDNGGGATGGNKVDNVDLDNMTIEELEFYFEIQNAQSFPETPAPVAPASQPTPGEPQPEPTLTTPSEPLPEPRPTASTPTSYPTAKAITPQPIAPPSESLAPNTSPDIVNTPPPSPTPTEDIVSPTSRPSLRPNSLPTAIETSSPVPPTPVECSTLTRRDALLAVVEDITDESVLMDVSTPQAQAFLWLLEEDAAQIDPCTYPTPEQRYILATFYFATVGSAWVASNGWLSADGECIWLGVNCNDSGGVTRLELRTSF
jgi:hypothetical protein